MDNNMQSKKIKIKVEHLRKSFAKNVVLKEINLTVSEGDVVTILGPSGSGKTTLLRCLNFLERADAGNLTIGESSVDLMYASSSQILGIRRKIGFVFQNFNLFKHKTAEGNVMEGLVTAQRVPEETARTRAREALDRVGLSDKYNAYPAHLSGGQQQRVGIARAIVLNPEVILFDEPTSALDPELIGETLNVIRNIAREGITMIIVTHELSFAYEISNHAIFMEGGLIVEENSPKELFYSPQEERTRQFLMRIKPENDYSV
jgi:L-cystine transport system ATP-binding protein